MAYVTRYRLEFDTIKERQVKLDIEEERDIPPASINHTGSYIFEADDDSLYLPSYLLTSLKIGDLVSISGTSNDSNYTIKNLEFPTTGFAYTKMFFNEPVTDETSTGILLTFTTRPEINLIGSTQTPVELSYANGEFEKMNPIRESKMRIKIFMDTDFEDQQAAFFNEIDQLQQKFNLKETDLISEYHKAWWADVIRTKATQLGYEMPDSVLTPLIYRWAFDDKSTNIAALKKQIDNAPFAEWVAEFDKKDFKQFRKQNLEPFESIFLRLGVLVLQNATNFLAANPSKTVQEIRVELAQLIRELQANPNPAILSKLELELKRIERLGGFDSIVPAEGIVFTYRGNTYKMTGAFAPVNQILGVLKYSR